MARKLNDNEVIPAKFLRKGESERKEATRDIIIYFLIVCEGEKTEPNYFKSFPKKNNSYVVDLTTGGGGISTKTVVETAITIRKNSSQKFDSVWAVFDKDSFTDNHFNSAIDKAEAHKIKCAWSNEAFELWYILHFHFRNTGMSRREYKKAIEDAVDTKLRENGNKNPKFKYTKNSNDMYTLLTELGDQAQAIKWAKSLEAQNLGLACSKQNPCTLVYKLVEELNGTSAELNKELKD